MKYRKFLSQKYTKSEEFRQHQLSAAQPFENREKKKAKQNEKKKKIVILRVYW
jgi:ADP-heptose:LPS heptosyltransferase